MKKILVITFSAIFLMGILGLVICGNEPNGTLITNNNGNGGEAEEPAPAEKADEAGEEGGIVIPDEVTLCKDSEENKPFTFTHKKHAEEYTVGGKKIDCTECHHKSEKEDYSDIQKCSACHPADPDDAEDDELILEEAYHEQCIDCHDIVLEEDEAANAPVDCTDCHKEK